MYYKKKNLKESKFHGLSIAYAFDSNLTKVLKGTHLTYNKVNIDL